MFVQTHRSTQDDATFTVYRDREAGRQVTHYTARRGGCLYLGEVTVKDEATHATFAFTVKQPPWPEENGAQTAQAYWTRHAGRVGR